MKYTILMGSPKRDGNTAALLEYQRSHFTEFDPMAEFTLDL